MSKNEKLIPELRFPEFKNEGEWKESFLGSVLEMKGRIGYRGYTTEDLVDKGKGAITLSPSNFNENGYLNFEKCTYISWDKYEESPEIQLEEGQTVLVKTASVGKTAYVDKLPEKTTVNPQIVVLKPRSIHNRFLAYTVSHQNTQDQIRNNIGAGAIPNISQEIISKLKILIPPDVNKKEQQKIASCLSSLDEVITAENQKLELLKDHKKGLMQNLFPQEGETVPKYRFKEFEKDGEWVEKTLIDTADKKVKWSFTGGPFGSNLMASDYTENGFRIIQLQNIGDGVFNDDSKIYASLGKADELLSCNIYAGEIIISKMGDPVGRACIIPDNLQRCIMASDGIRLVVDETKYSKYFIYSLINSSRIRESIEKRATGSTRKRIGLDTLREIKLILPKSLKEQQKIAACLSSLDALISAQAEKIDQLKLHKKGLMQGLFPKIND
jgi:type I restriction enzyme, S subunit